MTRHRVRALAATAALGATLFGGVGATAPAGAGTTEERTVSIRAVEPRDDVFFVKGRVRPDHPGGELFLQRKRPSGDHWRKWRTFRATEASRYRRRVQQLDRPGVVCYRVKVPGDDTYADAFSEKICIRTFWK